MNKSKLILPVIVISQFCCTSLWFAGNSVMNNLIEVFGFAQSGLGHLTSAVQFGFITGTLIFALLTIVDRFSPSKVFLYSATLGAISNVGIIWEEHTLTSILILRFLTGFFLAGIYPVGMKIAADHFNKGLGKSLGFLVGALVLGTAFPHLLKEITASLPWKAVLLSTSSLAVLGGILMGVLVPDGPYRKVSKKLDVSCLSKAFKKPKFRASAFGYFGHMWELYTFWAFVPVILKMYNNSHPEITFNIPLLSFFIIGIGGLACVLGGYISEQIGAKRTAFLSVLLSGICCLVSPIAFGLESEILFIFFLLFWGMVVVADSPLFSTLIAQNVASVIKGSALTLVNCIGFLVTIISIQLLNGMSNLTHSPMIYAILALGPLFSIIGLKSWRTESA